MLIVFVWKMMGVIGIHVLAVAPAIGARQSLDVSQVPAIGYDVDPRMFSCFQPRNL